MSALTSARRNRLALVVALLLIVMGVLWLARAALFPFVFALVLAYLMLPAVNWLDNVLGQRLRLRRAARPLGIILVYLSAVGLIVLFVSLVVPVVAAQFRVLWANRGQVIQSLQTQAEAGLAWYHTYIPPDIQAQVDDLLQRAAGALAGALQTGVTRTLGVLTSTISFILAMLVVPFWLFYILHDETKVARGILKLLPERYRGDALNMARIVDSILGAYIRGQLLLCVFIGIMATAGLTLLGVQYAAVLGLVAGIFEILPFVGPIFGMAPAVLVAAVQSPWLGLWTLVLFIGIQQIENLFLVPRISGKAVELHPALIVVVLVIGNEVAELWGMLVAVPLTAIVRDLFRYLYLRFHDEPVEPRDAMLKLRGSNNITPAA